VSLGVPGDDDGDIESGTAAAAAATPGEPSGSSTGGGAAQPAGAESPLEPTQQQQQQQQPKRPAFAVPPLPRAASQQPRQQAARYLPPPPLQQQPQLQQPTPPPLPYYSSTVQGPAQGPAVTSGRISVVTVAESLDRPALEALLKAKFPRLHVTGYQEVLHATPSLGETSGDLFVFDYGVACFWGIATAEEQALMHGVVRPCAVGPLDVREVEVDAFSYHYSATEPPHVQVCVLVYVV
jgi:uncharacterized Rmd1/YagE family protein